MWLICFFATLVLSAYLFAIEISIFNSLQLNSLSFGSKTLTFIGITHDIVKKSKVNKVKV